MDIIAHLKADHAKLASIFERLCSTTTRATKTRTELAAVIEHELEVHMSFEETMLYPAIKAAADEEGQDLTRESYAEHTAASDTLGRLMKMQTDDEMWKATMTVLKEEIEHHVKEEEGQLFPLARKLLSGDALQTMGEQYAAVKAKAKHPDHVAEHHTQLVGMH